MSPRAAWRLESLGFTQVFEYVAGEQDWFAYGLPRAGKLAAEAHAGELARPDAPTCRPIDRIGDVREQGRGVGWSACVVVNEERIVLGLLREQALVLLRQV